MNSKIKDIIARGRWQPIETAPRNARILIKVGEDAHVAQWVQNFINGDDAWAIAEIPDNTGGFDRVIFRNPTHWMPLPDEQLADLAEKQAELIEEFMLSENIEDIYHAKQKARDMGYGGKE